MEPDIDFTSNLYDAAYFKTHVVDQDATTGVSGLVSKDLSSTDRKAQKLGSKKFYGDAGAVVKELKGNLDALSARASSDLLLKVNIEVMIDRIEMLVKNAKVVKKALGSSNAKELKSSIESGKETIKALKKQLGKLEETRASLSGSPDIRIASRVVDEGFARLMKVLFMPGKTKTEGLFRASGDSAEIKQHVETILKDLNQGVEGLRGEKSIHNITGVMKSIIRDLAPPLIFTPEQRQLFAVAGGDKISDDKEAVKEQLREAVGQLPSENRKLLGTICKYLDGVATFAGTTKMDHSNLALVWWPNFIKDFEVDDVTSYKNAFEDLIRYAKEIF